MKSLRKWATPLTVGSFLILAVTGTLMFFHAETGLNKTVHEWIGLLMLAAVGTHVAVNWRAMQGYFRRPVALSIIGGGAFVLALSFLPAGADDGSPVQMVMQAVTGAPVERVIALGGQDGDLVMARLEAAGFGPVAGRSLDDLSGGDRGRTMELLRLALASE